jgi:long-chain acyl-CoA synthetase
MQTRPWHCSYPPHIPYEIALDKNETLHSLLESSLVRYAERIAASCLGETLTYAEMDLLSAGFSSYLQHVGLVKGERVAVMLPNGLPFLVAMSAALRAGMTVVAINPLYTPRELAHQLQDCSAKCVVVSEHLVPTLWQTLRHTAIEHVVRAPVSGLAAVVARLTASPDGECIGRDAEASRLDHGITLAGAIETGNSHAREHVPVSPGDIAFLQYTAGTTGPSKGAMLTHRSVCASLAQIISWSGFALNQKGSSVVTPLPLYHVYPLAVSLTAIALGANNRLIPDPRNTGAVTAEMQREPFELFLGVNSLFNSLSSSPELKSVDFSRTRLVTGAGAPVQPAVARRWTDAGGPAITEVYGMTETSPSVSFNPPGRSGTIGIPVPSTDVLVVNEQGQPVSFGETGELLVRGPQMFAGYWNREEETRQAFTADGWFKTGDVVRMQEDGFMFLVDRKKDMVLVSGFNVYPNEIEEVVMLLPGVRECACIGVPDERSGEAPFLFVVAQHEGLTPTHIDAHCRANLAAYKVPRKIALIDTLPKSAAGKILRKDLRLQYEVELRRTEAELAPDANIDVRS